MEKNFYFKFKKVGFIRNKMIFISSTCPAKTREAIYKKYGNGFYIFLVNA